MGTTENYGIPYPECAPPLRKDASDIADYRDLAEGADEALDVVYAQASDEMFNVDGVRMTMSATVLGFQGQDIYPFFDLASIDLGHGMADTANGVIRILEPGRYWCGTYATLGAVSALQARTRLLIDGLPVTNFQTPSFAVSASTAYALNNSVLSFDNPGTLSSHIRHSGGGVLPVDYAARIWAFQLEKF